MGPKRRRKGSGGYYLARVLPHQWWKRLGYTLTLLLALLSGYQRGWLVGVVLAAIILAARVADIIVTDALQKRRSVGWSNYYHG